MANISFTPLYGAQDRGPVSFLLRINAWTGLLDCGWGDPFDATCLHPVRHILDDIDAGGIHTS